jgi:hypothetical protein
MIRFEEPPSEGCVYDCAFITVPSSQYGVVFYGNENEFLAALEHGSGLLCGGANWWTFGEVMRDLFDDAEYIDWTSSAGDWTLAIRAGDVWFSAYQENDWPNSGFRWYIDRTIVGRTLDELCDLLTVQ